MLAGGAAFLGLYLVVMLVAVPGVARLSGRVALPCFPSGDVPVRAASIGYCLLGRNYLRPEYVPALEGVVREVEAKHGGVISYLDAGFPFAGVPLPPHLSHDDGRELDVAFRYRSATTHAPTASGPSPIGYWVYEAPRPSEPRPCSDAEGWLRWDLPWLQWLGASCELDEEATRDTIMSFAAQPEVEKILIEQHLIERLKITSNKVRFQGCRAARHDDHFHVHFRRDTNQARQ
jgi:murein endopeptidase